jgi:hypothetical protein
MMIKQTRFLGLGLAATLATFTHAGLAAAEGVASTTTAATVTTTARKGVTLGEGKLNLTVTLEPSLSRDSVFEPFSIAPDLSYGVTSKLTLALVHSGAAVTGFRGGAGSGLCLSGHEGKCPDVYRNVGFEGMVSLVEGPVALAAQVGVHFTSIGDPTTAKLKLGARTRASAGRLTLLFNPSLFVATNDRDRNTDALFLPVALSFKATAAFSSGVGTGLKLPDLGDIGGGYQIPVGVFGQLQLTRAFSAGASFVFGNLVGGEATRDGVDGRFLQLWASYTL